MLVLITVGAPPKAKEIGGRGGSPVIGGGTGTVVVVGTGAVVEGGGRVVLVVGGAVVGGGGTEAYPKLALLSCKDVPKLPTPARLAPVPATTRRPTALCRGYLRTNLGNLAMYLFNHLVSI